MPDPSRLVSEPCRLVSDAPRLVSDPFRPESDRSRLVLEPSRPVINVSRSFLQLFRADLRPIRHVAQQFQLVAQACRPLTGGYAVFRRARTSAITWSGTSIMRLWPPGSPLPLTLVPRSFQIASTS